ncbi:MAG: hypothetical protein ACR2P0_03915 [Acidimicrobiales bacterium]
MIDVTTMDRLSDWLAIADPVVVVVLATLAVMTVIVRYVPQPR